MKKTKEDIVDRLSRVKGLSDRSREQIAERTYQRLRSMEEEIRTIQEGRRPGPDRVVEKK